MRNIISNISISSPRFSGAICFFIPSCKLISISYKNVSCFYMISTVISNIISYGNSSCGSFATISVIDKFIFIICPFSINGSFIIFCVSVVKVSCIAPYITFIINYLISGSILTCPVTIKSITCFLWYSDTAYRCGICGCIHVSDLCPTIT